MWRGFSLISVDKCTLTLLDKKPLLARFGAHLSGKSGSVGPVSVEICCLFDSLLRIPTKVIFAKCDTSEFKLLPRLAKFLQKTDLVLMDNGFYSFKNFQHILKRGAHFIVPLDTKNRPKVDKKINADDYLCTITDSKTKQTMQVESALQAEREAKARARIAEEQKKLNEEMLQAAQKLRELESNYNKANRNEYLSNLPNAELEIEMRLADSGLATLQELEAEMAALSKESEVVPFS